MNIGSKYYIKYIEHVNKKYIHKDRKYLQNIKTVMLTRWGSIYNPVRGTNSDRNPPLT